MSQGTIRHLHLLALLIGLALSSAVQAATPIPVAGSQTELTLSGDQIGYLKESGERLSPDRIRTKTFQDQWQIAESNINFGYTTDTYWYRIQITNPSDKTLERFLEIDYALLDSLEAYVYTNGTLTREYTAGDKHPFTARPIETRTPTFPITLPAQSRSDVLIRVQTSGSHQVPLIFWKPETFISENDLETISRSIFYGMLVIIIMFNFAMALSMRDRNYLYYAVTCSVLLVVLMSMFGVAFQVFYPENPDLNERVSLLSPAIITLLFSMFAYNFYQSRGPGKPRRRLLTIKLLIVLTSLNTIGAMFLSYGVSTRLSVAMGLILSLTMLGYGLVKAVQGYRGSWFFIQGWGLLSLGVLVWLLNLIGALPPSFLTAHGIEIGAVGQSFMLTVALVYRFNQERERRLREEKAKSEAIAERKKIKGEILRQAKHNNLTKLPGRSVLEEALRRDINKVHEKLYPGITLTLIHLKGFDDLNKTLGHENADRYLKVLTARINRDLSSCSNAITIEEDENGTFALAHVEGVTFAIISKPLDSEELETTAEMFMDLVCQPMEFMGLELDVQVIAGCSRYPQDADSAKTLLRHAFIASDGSDINLNRLSIYDDSMNPYSERRLTLMTDLRKAISTDSLDLHLQPQITIKDQTVCGFEVLLRWTHPNHGFIPPDEFIGMAEQSGLIRPLTQWVIKNTLKFCATLDRNGFPVRMSINISAANLSEDDFTANLQELLDHYGVTANPITLEVTETATMKNPIKGLETLSRLKAAGFRIAIDDFGTGHSSLAYLKKLPAHEIKIDKSFVMEMATNTDDKTIVLTTIAMCQNMGYEVVAEGIENTETCSLLAMMGCDIMQGFYLARPMPRTNAIEWLETYSPSPTI